jgi:hypothetical protein
MKPGTSGQVNNDLSQWNDSWLMTFLRLEYYDKYDKVRYDRYTQKDKYILQNEMLEILSNQKQFYAMIKRAEDHNIIDKAIYDTVISELGKERIDEYVDKLDSISRARKEAGMEPLLGKTSNIRKKSTNTKKYTKAKAEKKEENAALLTVDGMESYLKKITDKSNRHSQLWLVFEQKDALSVKGDDDWQAIVIKCVNDACQKLLVDSFNGNIVVFNKLKTGISGSLYFYDNNEKLIRVTDISNIRNVIESEYLYLPKIHIYVLTDDNFSTDKKEELLKDIGLRIGHELVSIINSSYAELVNDNNAYLEAALK